MGSIAFLTHCLDFDGFFALGPNKIPQLHLVCAAPDLKVKPCLEVFLLLWHSADKNSKREIHVSLCPLG